jgi:hypothetical protein
LRAACMPLNLWPVCVDVALMAVVCACACECLRPSSTGTNVHYHHAYLPA